MNTSSTITALIARGLDSSTAEDLAKRGYTVTKMKQMLETKLVVLGLTKEFIQSLHSEQRPPIPKETVLELLWESRRTCCVCMRPDQPIIIHHIRPWEQSRSHDKDNLAVICVTCHDEAHTHHKMSMNLTPENIRDAKRRWNLTVKELAQDIVNQTINTSVTYWDYFNVFRLSELFAEYNLSPKTKQYNYLVSSKWMDTNGAMLEENWPVRQGYWLDFGRATRIYDHYKELTENLMEKINPTLIENWTRSQLGAVIKLGSYVIFQGAFYFRNESEKLCYGYRRSRGIRIHFTINPWYSTSTSGRCNLSGRRAATVFTRIRSINRIKNGLDISCTALAIGDRRTDFAWVMDNEDADDFELNADEFPF